MSSSIRLISSGFNFLDKKWGGIYRGGSYLLVGPRKSGRTLLGLQFALEAAKSQEVCLYFTTMRPKDLMIQAASLSFDIQSYMNQNLIIVVRVAPPNDVYDMPNPDNYLVEYMNDIITVVNQYNPQRIIFDELTPFIGFNNLDILKDSFLATLEHIEERDVSSLFIVGEPATERAEEIVDSLAQYVTGLIYLRKSGKKLENRFQGGQVVISPNVGHTEGQFSSEYHIEPYKGVTTDFKKNESTHVYTDRSIDDEQKKFSKIKQNGNGHRKSDLTYFTNVYNYNDFQLILNNQIALYKSTGQTFNLVVFKLDQVATVKGLLTVNQLQNAIRLASDKKDKICAFDNKVVVLLVKSSSKNVINLIQSVQDNLPSNDMEYINAVQQYISIFTLEVDESVENAESLIRYALDADRFSGSTYTPLTKYNE
jgi:circadian clock protein KaiC